MYPKVKELLEEMGYEVFSEVQPSFTFRRADVVGYNKPAVCIVEMKTSLTMDLIQQAYQWLPYAHYVYIAIPKRVKGIHDFVFKVLKGFGIGIIEVDWFTDVSLKAKFNRPVLKKDWDNELLPEHKTWLDGGSSGGGYVTPYKLTMSKVRSYLERKYPRWVPLSEILEHCETHYRSPKNSLSNALRKFEQEWCETKVINRKLHLRIKKNTENK